MNLLNLLMLPCPVCKATQGEPREFCRRCGCHLLLLAKAKLESSLTKK